MTESPFFTILTASLNNRSSIQQTIESVKDQTLKNLEHIVFDGGSSDGTIKILKEMENSYNLSWISEPDDGIANALNKGLKLAGGKYVLVLGADDHLIESNTLSFAYDVIKEGKIDIYSSPVIVDHPVRGGFYYNPCRFLWWHHFKTIFPHQGTFVHKRVFMQVGNFCEDFSISFDYDFFYRALKIRPAIKFGANPISLMGGTGISGNQSFLTKRLNEEYLVQRLNETNPAWKKLQVVFRKYYYPYKTGLVPSLTKSS